MKTMTVEWQRLIANGKTCDRCACTGGAAEAAFDKLKRCLIEVGIDVLLEMRALDKPAFEANPLESNRIRIDGTTLEQWLDGSTGQSQCCGPCGDTECRTITVDSKTYEAIPEELILRAGLLAAAEKLRQDHPTTASTAINEPTAGGCI